MKKGLSDLEKEYHSVYKEKKIIETENYTLKKELEELIAKSDDVNKEFYEFKTKFDKTLEEKKVVEMDY